MAETEPPPPPYNPEWAGKQPPTAPGGPSSSEGPPPEYLGALTGTVAGTKGPVPAGGPGDLGFPIPNPGPIIPINATPVESSDVDVEFGSPPALSTQQSLEFSSKSVRQGFIRKVFGLLSCMLAVVVGVIAAFLYAPGVKFYISNNTWTYWIGYAIFLIVYLPLMCCKGVRRKVPLNFFLLVILTLAVAYMTATISCTYDTKIVLIGMGITAVCCMLVALFAINTKYDLTSCQGIMFMIFIVVFIFGMFAIIFRNEILIAVYGGIMAVVFMGYLAIDIQLLMGGKRFEVSPEDYIFITIQLFMDIIIIFLYILQALGKK